MRCLSLADALSAQGATCEFTCRSLPGDLTTRIFERGYAVCEMALDRPYVRPASTDDYAGWLQVSEISDAEDFVRAAQTLPDAVIVDHYGLNNIWESRVRRNLPGLSALVAIDDLCRVHTAHCIVDQTIGRQPDAYEESLRLSADTVVLTGADYALLRPQFADLHSRVDRLNAPARHRVLVTMGGGDRVNATLAVIESISGLRKDWLEKVDVVLPETAPGYSAVAEFMHRLGARYELHGFVTDLERLMVGSTLCIGAPGSTAWERAALGLPSILIPLAENQLHAARVLADMGAILLIRLENLNEELPLALDIARSNWRKMAQVNLGLVDGLGAPRVARRIMAL